MLLEEEKLKPALAKALDRELHDHRVSICTGDKLRENIARIQSQHALLGHLSNASDPLQLVNDYLHEGRMVS